MTQRELVFKSEFRKWLGTNSQLTDGQCRDITDNAWRILRAYEITKDIQSNGNNEETQEQMELKETK